MAANRSTISGSYDPRDVTFLLKRVALDPTEVTEKERLIQSGEAHYSEMISTERRPDHRYLAIFEDAFARHKTRIAREIQSIAAAIAHDVSIGVHRGEIALCSLVRAGVPYGVLLRRALDRLGIPAPHYGVSIIRDRGIDETAMTTIRARHPGASILFVDGWTGKGAIATELRRAWRNFEDAHPTLIVLADPSGFATLSGSHEDWLIPSGILGANVSGLISRTILNDRLIGPGDYHGAIPVDHLADIDASRGYVDAVSALFDKHRDAPKAEPDPALGARLREEATACVRGIAAEFDVENINRIKPGIAEATRAVLRRKPHRVFLRDDTDPDLAALLHLCSADGVEIEVAAERTGPYRAVSLIGKVS